MAVKQYKGYLAFAEYSVSDALGFIFKGNAENDRIIGTSGADMLKGGAGDDYLSGGKGNDILVGGSGNNTLKGGSGSDMFVLGSQLNGSIDRIVDFSHRAGDKILLNATVFEEADIVLARGFVPDDLARGRGALDASNFVVGESAETGSHHFIYDRASGALSYDADGSGAGAAVKIAQFKAGTSLGADDFLFF